MSNKLLPYHAMNNNTTISQVNPACYPASILSLSSAMSLIRVIFALIMLCICYFRLMMKDCDICCGTRGESKCT